MQGRLPIFTFMEITLLESGDIFYQIAKKIDSTGITITAVATNRNDEKYLGYSIFKVNQVIDGGIIYFQKGFEVSEENDINSIRNKIDHHLTVNVGGYIKNFRWNGTCRTKKGGDYICNKKDA